MLKFRQVLVVLGMLVCPVVPATAQVSIGIGFPHVSIGINLPAYPDLVRVPGYPVYYAPQLDANYFFYDGLYWVFLDDNWYVSSWYNGPWELVDPYDVPVFILRIPVRYYRRPPVYFRAWAYDAAPRWGAHWGYRWERRRAGWDRWNRRAAPPPAPLPFYQRQYSGDRYPRQVERQRELNRQNYRYQPNEPVARRHFLTQPVQNAPAPAPVQRGMQEAPRERHPGPQGNQRPSPPPPVQQSAPGAQPPPRSEVNLRGPLPPTQAPSQTRGTAGQERDRLPQQGAIPDRQQQMQGRGERHQGKEARPEPNRGQERREGQPGREQDQGQGRGRGGEQGQERGQDHDRGRDRNE